MIVKCPKCLKTTETKFDIDYLYFSCPNCNRLFSYKSQKYIRVKSLDINSKTALSIGQKGIIDNEEFIVTGSLTKKDTEHYEWTEYILQSENYNFLYLSEFRGHWTLLKEVDTLKDVEELSKGAIKADIKYGYQDNSSTLVSAAGFFDFNPDTLCVQSEYNNPPYLLSIEQTTEKAIYFGKYFSRKEMKKAFKNIILPPKIGIGLLQTYSVNLQNMAFIFLFISLFLITANIFIYSGEKEADILSSKINFSENKTLLTPSFELSGKTGNLIIDLYSPVLNSWTSCDVILVNESNNNKEYAFKDIEYYFGYDGGESWSEGSQKGTIKICGVSKGKYHLEFSTTIDNLKNSNGYMDIKIKWVKPSYWNLVMVLGSMLVILIIFYILKKHFERRRYNENY